MGWSGGFSVVPRAYDRTMRANVHHVASRMLQKVEDGPNGCWLWTGATQGRSGHFNYGQVTVDNKRRLAHRVAHELWVGPIPDGYEVDHLCRTPLCINPDHLEAVTPEENMRRAMPARDAYWEAFRSPEARKGRVDAMFARIRAENAAEAAAGSV